MIQTRVKVLGLLIAALALSFVVLPGMALATTPAEKATALLQNALSANPLLEVKPLAEESCQSGNVCIWTSKEYKTGRSEFRCVNEYHPNLGSHHSAKNRCPDRPAFFFLNGAMVFCMNAGGDRPNSPEFNGFAVTNVGEHC